MKNLKKCKRILAFIMTMVLICQPFAYRINAREASDISEEWLENETTEENSSVLSDELETECEITESSLETSEEDFSEGEGNSDESGESEEALTESPETEADTTEADDGSYSINMEMLAEEIELSGVDSDACVATWKAFVEESSGLTAGKDYIDGVFVYPATSVYDASLTAGIFGGEFISFSCGIATMRVADHSTVEVIQTCIDMSEVGNMALPEIYPDMIWECLTVEDSVTDELPAGEGFAGAVNLTVEDSVTDESEDELELQFALGGYDDWSHIANKDYTAWNYATGKGVKIAILDTGAGDHASLKYAGNYNAFVKNYADAETAKLYAGSYKNTTDNSGHGTAMAGIAAGRGGNSSDSIVGVAPEAVLISIKCMENYGDAGIYGDLATITRAVYIAVENGCKIINISAGGHAEYGSLFADALKSATDKGVVVICGAGNNGDDTSVYPAAYSQTIAVSATKKTADGQEFDASYSSYGNNVEIAAPGTGVVSTWPGNMNKTISGTSVSAAMVSGAIALYMERNPELQSQSDYKVLNKIRDALENSAVDCGDKGYDEKYGWGVLDTSAIVSDRNFNPTDVPKISVPSGPIHAGYGIKLSSSNGAGSIYYTLDGTIPTVNSLKYTSERDIGGYIYLPANLDTVTLTAVSIGLKNTTKAVSAKYTIVPDSISINDNKFTYNGILGKSGFYKDCKYITGVSKGKDMPYQKFTATLNGGDSIDLSLLASGFNGELHLVVNNVLKTSDMRPVSSAQVGTKYSRTLKYTNATTLPQSIEVIVTSGQLLPGQPLLNGSGKYALTANITRAVSKIEMTLPSDVLVKGSSMTASVKITPYNATNQKIHWKLYDKYGEELDKSLATVDGLGKITITKDVNALTEYRITATADADKEITTQKTFKVYPLTTRLEIVDDVVDITSNGPLKTYDASTNFVVTPSNCLNKYTYKSTNERIATVSASGLVTGVSKGTARIVVYAADGSGKKGAFYVNVKTIASSVVLTPSTKVEAIKNYYPVYAGSSLNIIPSISPANISNSNMEYTFSGTAPEGVVLKKSNLKIEKTALPGTVFSVTGKCLDGSNVKNTINFKIYGKPSSITLNQSAVNLNTINGKTSTLVATVIGQDGTSNGILQNVVWTSNNTDVVRVSQGGVLTAVGRGNAVVRATSSEGARVFASCKVRVISGVTSIGISTAGAVQSPDEAQPVVSGRKTALKAICTPADADKQEVDWSLELAPEGVTMENGVINVPSYVTSGSVLVKATAKDGFGATKTRSFNIYTKSVTKVVIASTASSLNTVTAPKCTLTATVSPRVGTFGGVVWKSSDERVATVSQTGVVTAVGKGNVTITAYSKDGYGAKSAIRLNVVQPMTSFEIESGKGLFTTDGKILLTTGPNIFKIKNIKPLQVSDKRVTWSLIGNTEGISINPNTGGMQINRDIANRITNLTVRATVQSSGAYIEKQVEVYPHTDKVCLSLADSKVTLNIGGAKKLSATTMPLHAYNSYPSNPFKYTSSNPKVATVSADGTVTGVSKGSTIILVEATDGSRKKAKAKIVVK